MEDLALRFAAVVVVAVCGACSKEPAPSPTPPTPPTPPATATTTTETTATASTTPVATGGACMTDDDCVLVNGLPPSCCSRCGGEAMTKKEAADANAACAKITSGRSDYFASCPHLSCPCRKEKAVCASGHCKMTSGPCQ